MDAQKKSLTVTQSNRLTNAAYRLTLNEQRLVLLVLTKLDSKNTDYSNKAPEIAISAKEFASAFNLGMNNVYKQLKEAGDQIYERELRFRLGEKHYRRSRWVSDVEYHETDGVIKLFLNPRILPLLTQLKGNFTTYDLTNTANFKSVYSHRIYQFLAQWKSNGRAITDIDGLRQKLELGKTYDQYKFLKSKILTPALKEINKHSNFKVELKEIKKGRKVTGIHFQFSEKTSQPYKKPYTAIPLTPYKQAERSEETDSLPDLDINTGLKKIRMDTFGDFFQ